MLLEHVWIGGLVWSDLAWGVGPILLVYGDDTGATEAKVMLEGDACIGHLALLSHASQLPAQLSALGKTCGTERVSLGDQTTARVDNASATVSEVVAVDSLASFAFCTESQCLIRDQLIGTETVMKLNDIDLVSRNPSHLISLIRSRLGHRPTNQINR